MDQVLPPSPSKCRLKNGRLACYTHRLSRCSACMQDSTYVNYDDSYYDFGGPNRYRSFRNGYDDNDPEGWEKEDFHYNPLRGYASRFMPQWDDQFLRPENQQHPEARDYSNPPRPDSLLPSDFHTCRTCQLTWIAGPSGPYAASSHPSHHACYDCVGTQRSLIVYTDGSCLDNGTVSATCGVGVFFQENSRFNISGPLVMESGAQPSNQKAELHAILCAMQTVRLHVVPERQNQIQEVGYGRSEEAKRNIADLRLVIATDSSYAVECMVQYLLKWRWHASRQVYMNKDGRVIENSQGFRRLVDEVDALARVGVQVVYYRITREENSQADRLANEGSRKARMSPWLAMTVA